MVRSADGYGYPGKAPLAILTSKKKPPPERGPKVVFAGTTYQPEETLKVRSLAVKIREALQLSPSADASSWEVPSAKWETISARLLAARFVARETDPSCWNANLSISPRFYYFQANSESRSHYYDTEG